MDTNILDRESQTATGRGWGEESKLGHLEAGSRPAVVSLPRMLGRGRGPGSDPCLVSPVFKCAAEDRPMTSQFCDFLARES